MTFLAELNKLELWVTDIGNAYLESYTKEKVAFIAGPEFGEHEGHTFIIIKALYGLRSSGAPWQAIRCTTGVRFPTLLGRRGHLDERAGRSLRVHCVLRG
jgi:hypothetical protein